MSLGPKVYPQFLALIDALQEYAKSRADLRQNTEQCAWVDLCTSQDTRKELLEGLDRVALNEEFKQMSETGVNLEVSAAAIAELQHDFIAAVARDFFMVRSSRLSRLFRQSTIDRGYAGDDGVFKAVILRYIEMLISMAQAADD